MLVAASSTLLILCVLVVVLLPSLSTIHATATSVSPDEESFQNPDLRSFDAMMRSFSDDTTNPFHDDSNPASDLFRHYVGMSVLYLLREEQFKQGGDREALRYTQLALDYHHAKNDEDNDNSTSSSNSVRHSLIIHLSRLLDSIGNHTSTLQVVQAEIDRHVRLCGEDDRLLLIGHHNNTSYGNDDPFSNCSNETMVQRGQLYYAIGGSLLHAGHSLESIPWLQRAILFDPCTYPAYFKLANAMRDSKGKMTADSVLSMSDGLSKQIQRVLNSVYLDSDQNKLLLRSHSHNHSHSYLLSDDFQYMELLVSFADLSQSWGQYDATASNFAMKSALFWALHHTAEAVGDLSLSFFYLQQARHMEQRRIQETAPSILETMQARWANARRITLLFPADRWNNRQEEEEEEDTITNKQRATRRPIFVIGFFRSGSTLFESLLDSHPRIWGMGERSPLFRRFAQLQQLLSSSADSNKRKQQLDRHAAEIEQEMARECQLQQVNRDDNSGSGNCELIVDKLLGNYRAIGIIHTLFPNAIIFHMVRDPVDTLLSCMKNRFAGDSAAYTLHFKWLVREYATYLATIHHFRSTLPYNKKKRRQQAMVDVRYDMLVASPALVMKDIFHLIAVDPLNASEVDSFYQQDRLVRTASYLQVRQPVYRSSVGHWQQQGNQLQHMLIEELRAAIDKLVVNQAVPFHDDESSITSINWRGSRNFNYSLQLDALEEIVSRQQGLVLP